MNKARQRNIEKNRIYLEIMPQFLNLKLKENKTDKEEELQTSLANESDKYNNEFLFKTQFHAGIISDDLLNRDRIFKTLKKRQKAT